MPFGFRCLTKTAFMRRPWRITPCPGVHAGAFLVVKHNSTDSKSLRYALTREYVCAAVPAVCGPVHIQNNKNKKYINNRYNLPIMRINML